MMVFGRGKTIGLLEEENDQYDGQDFRYQRAKRLPGGE
jgi:hypothetical protein